jgi:hypothetical protein
MRRLLLTLSIFICLLSSHGHAAVTLNATATAVCSGSAIAGATGLSCSTLTVAAGTNIALVCALNFSLPTVTGVAVTWNAGQSMTQIVAGTQTSVGDAQLWGLVAPATGANAAKATWTGTSDLIIYCEAWNGVNQTGGATTFPNSTSASNAGSTPATLTITSAAGDATMATVTATVGDTLTVPSQAQLYNSTTTSQVASGASNPSTVPTLVQHVQSGQDGQCCGNTGTQGTGNKLQLTFPQPAGAGNLIVGAATFDDRSGITTLGTITDNIGTNTWVKGPICDQTTAHLYVALFYALNVAAGTQAISIPLAQTALNDDSYGGVISEFYNVALTSAVDGTALANCAGAASPYTSGSITTTVAGDLVWLYGASGSGGSGTLSAITPGAAGSGFTLLGADINAQNINAGTVAEYQVQAASGAINPNFTTTGNTTLPFGNVGIAFKKAVAGTPPRVFPRIVHVSHFYFNNPPGTFQFPATGNLLVGLLNGTESATGNAVTAVSSVPSNTWVENTNCATWNPTALAFSQIVYAAAATTSSSLVITLTVSANVAATASMLVMYDVVGAAASPFDNCVHATGNATSYGVTAGDTITPAAAGGIVFSDIAISWHDIQSVTTTGTTGATFDKVVLTGLDDAPDDQTMGGTPNSTLDEDNGNAHVIPTSTSPILFNWSGNGNELTCYPSCNDPAGFGQWSSATASFLGASSVTQTYSWTVGGTVKGWVEVGTDILAFVAAAGACSVRLLLGVGC